MFFQRTKANDQLILWLEFFGHIHAIDTEHVLRVQNQFAIQPDICNCCETLEVQEVFNARVWLVKVEGIPPVEPVEVEQVFNGLGS